MKSINSEKYALKWSLSFHTLLALVVASLRSHHWIRLLLLHSVLTFLTPTLLWALSPSPTVAQFVSPPRRSCSMTFEKSELSGCLQMLRCCLYNKYLVNKPTTLPLYQKSFLNKNIVNPLSVNPTKWSNVKLVLKGLTK